MNKFIPLSVPNFEGNEEKYVLDATRQGWVSTGGEYVATLEKNLARYINTDDIAVCQSGTSALHLSLIEADVKPGDAVIVSPLTFIAAVNPIRYQFANPIFVDCDDSLCLDPKKLLSFIEEECIFENGKLYFNRKHIKAIIVVHVFGNLADMESIMKIAKKFNLIVIEDSTEALGSYYLEGMYKGKFAGTIGDFGAFSFNGNKIITTGGGGAVTSRNKKSVSHMRYLSTQAKDDTHYYIHNEVGYNYRMTNVQAALGVAQLEQLDDFIERKNRNYLLYKEHFESFDCCSLMEFKNDIYSNKWFYSILINKDKVKCNIREIINELGMHGVQTRAIWGLINEQKPYQKEYSYKIEKSKYYAERIINIPCSTNITEEEINYVAEQIKSVLRGKCSE